MVDSETSLQQGAGLIMTKMNNERSFEIGGSMEAFEAVEDLYEIAKNKGEEWSGLLLDLTSNGKFSIELYYEATPLLDGDSNLVKERMGC